MRNSNKPKHTPGPWSVGEITNPNKLVKSALILSPAGGVIATASNITTAGTLSNAALIAAAPEMLDALEFILDTWHMDDHSKELAKSAIRKAKGETV